MSAVVYGLVLVSEMSTAAKKTADLTRPNSMLLTLKKVVSFRIALPDSPHPINSRKKPGFRVGYFSLIDGMNFIFSV